MSLVERKYMAHYLDTSFQYVPGESASFTKNWYRLGEDLDEYNIELNPTISVAQNVYGEDTLIHENYEISGEAKSFYARSGDTLYDKLQDIIDNLKMNRFCYTLALDVRLWEKTTYPGVDPATDVFKAYMRPCYVVPTSFGGDTSGYQIPFNVYYLNTFSVYGAFLPDRAGSGSFLSLTQV